MLLGSCKRLIFWRTLRNTQRSHHSPLHINKVKYVPPFHHPRIASAAEVWRINCIKWLNSQKKFLNVTISHYSHNKSLQFINRSFFQISVIVASCGISVPSLVIENLKKYRNEHEVSFSMILFPRMMNYLWNLLHRLFLLCAWKQWQLKSIRFSMTLIRVIFKIYSQWKKPHMAYVITRY